MNTIKKLDLLKNAEYLAKDEDELWFLYEDEPALTENCWDNPNGITCVKIDEWLIPDEIVDCDWRESLFKLA